MANPFETSELLSLRKSLGFTGQEVIAGLKSVGLVGGGHKSPAGFRVLTEKDPVYADMRKKGILNPFVRVECVKVPKKTVAEDGDMPATVTYKALGSALTKLGYEFRSNTNGYGKMTALYVTKKTFVPKPLAPATSKPKSPGVTPKPKS